MSARYRIGGIARLTGRTVDTIRWYEKQGLIPGVERDAGGRRVYRHGHVGWLAFLERLSLTGMSIADMRRYACLAVAGKDSLQEQRELLGAHRERVEAEMEELEAALDLIDRKLAYYDEWEATGTRPIDPEAGATAAGNRRGRRKRRRKDPAPAPG